MEKPRVLEGIVLDRDGSPVAGTDPTPGAATGRFGGRRVFRLSARSAPLVVVGAVVALPIVLALLMIFAAFMIVFTLAAGRRPRFRGGWVTKP